MKRKLSSCGTCDDNTVAAKLFEKWKHEFPLDPHQPKLGSWLFKRAGKYGCKACYLTGAETDFGRCELSSKSQLRRQRFKKHESGLSHKVAVANLTKCKQCQAAVDAVNEKNKAPPVSDWEEVLHQRRQGGALRHLTGIGGRKKMQKMEGLLAEAMRIIERRHIRESSCIALHTDGRACRLTVRFAAGIARTFDVRRGCFGHTDYVGLKKTCQDTSLNLAAATLQVLKNFCTFLPKTPKEKILPELYKHIRKSVELLDADAEKTVQLASEELSNALKIAAEPHFPNATFVCKDFTHGARRVLERPIAAISELNEVLDTIVLSPKSIMQRIRHSPEFRDRLNDNIDKEEESGLDSKGIDNGSNAKHRFDSCIKPLERQTVIPDPFLATAKYISVTRKGQDEGGDADNYIKYLAGNAGIMRILYSGGILEYGQTCMPLLRFFDTEHYDAAEVEPTINIFLHGLYVLFVKRKAFTIPG